MIKVACNVDLTRYSNSSVAFSTNECIKKGSVRILNALRNISNDETDALLLFNPTMKEIILCALSKCILHKKTFLFDATLKKPKNFLERALCLAKGYLINRCNKFIVVHKNLSEYYLYYSINKKKVEYVPFKSNCFEIKDTIETQDHGYILSCGASHRDYDTLIEAVRDSSQEVIIVLPNHSDATLHKSKLNSSNTPKNVRVVRHDFSRASWYEYLRKSSIVVIPIDKDCIQPAGISVYLEAMSIGKPTIISRGPSTDGLIDDQAILINRSDPAQLKAAIESLMSNKELRETISKKGKEYALSLGGIERLTSDLKRVISKEFSDSN